MLPFGHAVGAVVTGRFTLARGNWFPPHVHSDAHQLVWASRGVLSVRAEGATWVLPPGIALWLPAGTEHETGAAVEASMAGIYIDPQRCPIDWPVPTVVAVDGLQRQLLVHLQRSDLDAGSRRRAEATLLDVLQPTQVALVDLPDPLDARAAAVAAALTADPSDPRSLEAWDRTVGASSRTLARTWATDTGVPFGVWRTRLRISAALPLLAAGDPIGTVAGRVGIRPPARSSRPSAANWASLRVGTCSANATQQTPRARRGRPSGTTATNSRKAPDGTSGQCSSPDARRA